MFGLLFSQAVKPANLMQQHPLLLVRLFYLTILLSIMMLFCFLHEMTFYTHSIRAKVFKQELTKVFFTITTMYFVAFWYTKIIEWLAAYA